MPVTTALLLAAGCIKVDQDLVLNADGSGTLHIRYGMKQETITQIEGIASPGAAGTTEATSPQLPFRFDEKQVREDFKVYARDGVTLDSFRSEDAGGWKFVDLNMRFKSLAGLMQTEFLADRKVVLHRDASGNFVLEQQPDNPHVPERNADNPAVQDMMRELMKGFRASVSVKVPGDVVESSGSATGRVVSWVFDLEKDAEAISKAQKLNMRVVFKGDGLEQLPVVGKPAPAATK